MKSGISNRNELTLQSQRQIQRFVLRPNRSLPYRGKIVLITVIAIGLMTPLSFVSGVMIWYLFVPAGLTFSGMLLALWSNERAGKFREIIEVSPDFVRIRCVGIGRPDFEVQFNPYWAKLSLETDRYVENRIVLSQSGQSYSIGEFLAPEERETLSGVLAETISRSSIRQ